MAANTKLQVILELKDKAGKGIKSVGQKLKDFASNVVTSRIGLAALSAAAGIQIMKFAELETALTNVATLFGGTTADIERMRQEVNAISREIPQSAQDLAEAYFDVVSAGVDAKEAAGFLRDAAKLAVAGVTDTKTTVDGLTSVINAYGMEAEEVTRVSDLFFSAQQKGKTNIEELSASIGRVAPIANASGISLEELLSQISAITVQGVQTSEAVSGVKAAISNILKPSEDAAKAAERLGVQFDAQTLKSKGLVGILKEVYKASGNNTEEFKNLFGSIEGLNAVTALAAKEFEAFDDTQQALADSAGVVDREMKKQTETISNQFILLKNNINSLSSSVVKFFEPAIKGVLSNMNKLFVKAIAHFEDYQKKIESFSTTQVSDEQIKLEAELDKVRAERLKKVEWLNRSYIALDSFYARVHLQKYDDMIAKVEEKLKGLRERKKVIQAQEIEDLKITEEKKTEIVTESAQLQSEKTVEFGNKAYETDTENFNKSLENKTAAYDAYAKNIEDINANMSEKEKKRVIKDAEDTVAITTAGVNAIVTYQKEKAEERKSIESDYRSEIETMSEAHTAELKKIDNTKFDNEEDRREAIAKAERDYREATKKAEDDKNKKLKQLNDDFASSVVKGVKEALKAQIDIWVAGYIAEATAAAIAAAIPTMGGSLLGLAAQTGGILLAAEVAKNTIDGVKMAEGGIVPGTSYTGDKVPVSANSGEMYLTREQQTRLFKMANTPARTTGRLDAMATRSEQQTVLILTDDGTQLAEAVYDKQTEMVSRGTLQERG